MRSIGYLGGMSETYLTSYIAFGLAGCPPMCRHLNVSSSFGLLERLCIKAVIVDLPAASKNVDLTPFFKWVLSATNMVVLP